MRNLKRWMLIMILGTLLLSIPMALAQAEAPAEAEATAPGISAGVLLLGLGGIIAVGGVMIARDSFKSEGEAE